MKSFKLQFYNVFFFVKAEVQHGYWVGTVRGYSPTIRYTCTHLYTCMVFACYYVSYFQPKVRNIQNYTAYGNFCDYSIPSAEALIYCAWCVCVCFCLCASVCVRERERERVGEIEIEREREGGGGERERPK